MNAQRFVLFSGLVVVLLTLTSFKNVSVFNNQEIIEVNAVYDGHEDYGYNFIAMDSDDIEYIITFQEVKKDVLKAFDLDSEALINQEFKISYTTKTVVTEDDDGDEYEEEFLTIVKLEKL